MEVKFFSLSTCIWCKKMRQYLDEAKIPYLEVAVDTLKGKSREEAVKELERYNPRKSFPTVVFDQERVVVGFKPEEIREAMTTTPDLWKHL